MWVAPSSSNSLTPRSSRTSLLPLSRTPALTGVQPLPFASHTTSVGAEATLPGFIPVTTHCHGGSTPGLGAPFQQPTAANPISTRNPTLFMLIDMFSRNQPALAAFQSVPLPPI